MKRCSRHRATRTRAGLIDCVPHLEPDPPVELRALVEVPGVVPALTDLGPGCAFAPRCSMAVERCEGAKPALEGSQDGHATACWVTTTEPHRESALARRQRR